MLNSKRENKLHPYWRNILPAGMEKTTTAEELPFASAPFNRERLTSHSGAMKIAVQHLFNHYINTLLALFLFAPPVINTAVGIPEAFPSSWQRGS